NDEAFEYIERAKSRALLELLTANINYLEILEKDSITFQRASKLLQEIEEIQNSLDSANKKEAEDGDWDQERKASLDKHIVAKDLLDGLEQKQRRLAEMLSDLATFSPDAASLFQVVPSRILDTQKILDSETLLLGMYQSENSLELFLIGNTGQILTTKVTQSARQSSEDIYLLINNIKESKHLDIRSHDFIRQIRAPLTHFYDFLIEPFSEHINRAKRLIISPHLFWHYFPFQSLYCQKDKLYLIDKIEICVTPTASILASCMKKERTSRDSALILAKNNGDLPYVDKEADLLAGAFYPKSEVYKNTDAYFKRTAQKQFDVVHFACHGSFNGEFPFLSGIDIPPEAGSNRRTTILDFFSQKLESSLVTMSACESGLNQFTIADELIGLSRGLFYAGTASIMASLWQVADASTCYLMENFYWHYVKNRRTKTHALQLAMQAVKAKEEYANPYFWSPFIILGDWR
nr:CHAT domain-containing protein [Desulfobulbaceae bacterium]